MYKYLMLVLLLAGCGFAKGAREDVQAIIDKANAAEQNAREEAVAAWNMTACQICTYSNCFSGLGCTTATDATCSSYATSYCQEVGCHKFERLQECQAYIQICRDSKRSDYENYEDKETR